MKLIAIAIITLLLLGRDNKIYAAAAISSEDSTTDLNPNTVNVNGENTDCFSVSNAGGPILTVDCTDSRVYMGTDSTEFQTFSQNNEQLLIVSTDITTVNLAVRNIASQSGNQMEWQASNGAAVGFVTSGGSMLFNAAGHVFGGSTGPGSTTLTVDARTTQIGMIITGRVNQSEDLMRVYQQSTGGQYWLHTIEPNGNVGFFDQSPDALLEIKSTGPVSGTDFILAVSSQNDVTGNIMAVMGTGAVGFSTTTPNATVHIRGISGLDVLTLEASDNDQIMTVTNTQNIGIGTTNPTSRLHVDTFGSSIELSTGVEAHTFFIDTSGNIGIGTDLADHKIDLIDRVNSETLFRMNNDGSGDVGLLLSDTGGQNWAIGMDTDNSFFISSATSVGATGARLAILTDGNVGIGTASPTALFQVGGSIIHAEVSTGNVGIGTGSPNARLQIGGPGLGSYQYLRLDVESTQTSADCNENDEVGRVFIDSNTISATDQICYCGKNTSDVIGWLCLTGS